MASGNGPDTSGTTGTTGGNPDDPNPNGGTDTNEEPDDDFATAIYLDEFDASHDENCTELNKLTSPPPPGTTNPYTVDNSEHDPTGENTNTRIAITNISSQLVNNYEYGYGLYNRGDFPTYGSYAHYVPASDDDHVYFPARQDQFGTLHTHPANSTRIPMFSHDDIYTLLSVKNNYGSFQMANTPNGNAVFVSVLVVRQGGQTRTYAIKIEDITKLQQLQAIWDDKGDANEDGIYEYKNFESRLEKAYINDSNGVNGSANSYQKTFLNFVKDENLGVSLYEMVQINPGTPDVAETWKKLTLDSNSPDGIKKTPCN